MSKIPSQFDIDLAAVCGTTPKNNDKLTAYKLQARTALNITTPTRSLTADDKELIIEWHKERLKLSDDKQVDIEKVTEPLPCGITKSIETAPTNIEEVKTKPPAVVDTIADDTPPALNEVETAAVNEAVALINAPLSELELLRIENTKLQARLEAVDHKAAPTYDIKETVRIAFYIGDKRTVIALSGFYLNALMLAAGIDKKGVPKWIKTAVDSWGAFDDKLNVTEQVKLLIVRELEKAYK